MAYGTPGLHTHQEWLGLVQPVGLVVAPVVLTRLGLFPESQPRSLADGQRRLLDLLEEVETPDGEIASAVDRFEDLATELLSWEPGDLIPAERFTAPIEVSLEEYSDVLRPSYGLQAPGQGGKVQALVQEMPAGTVFDEPLRGAGWEATPQQRFERLLKESEHPIGLLFNGVALRLGVRAAGGIQRPPHASRWSRWPRWRAGRCSGPCSCCWGWTGCSGGSSDQRPAGAAGGEPQGAERGEHPTGRAGARSPVGTAAGLRCGRTHRPGRPPHGARHLPADQPDHVYGGLITVLLRLVFLLYAEDEDLMPPIRSTGSTTASAAWPIACGSDRDEHQGGDGKPPRCLGFAAEPVPARLRRRWRRSGLPAGPSRRAVRSRRLPLPGGPRAGQRTTPTASSTQLPAISDDVVEKVLSKLLWLEGEIGSATGPWMWSRSARCTRGSWASAWSRPAAPAWESPTGRRARRSRSRWWWTPSSCWRNRQQAGEMAGRAGRA